jgi:hypothetical protein
MKIDERPTTKTVKVKVMHAIRIAIISIDYLHQDVAFPRVPAWYMMGAIFSHRSRLFRA